MKTMVVVYSPASKRHQDIRGFLYEVLGAYVRPRRLGGGHPSPLSNEVIVPWGGE